MMKLIADSSANLTMLEGVTYQSVPIFYISTLY